MQPYNPAEFNVLNSIFPGYNDKHGLMFCGYEEGGAVESENEGTAEQTNPSNLDALERIAGIHSFHYKKWPGAYDRNIHKWFDFFGHPLGQDGGFSAFDKSILQTNWGPDAAPHIDDYSKFSTEAQRVGFVDVLR